MKHKRSEYHNPISYYTEGLYDCLTEEEIYDYLREATQDDTVDFYAIHLISNVASEQKAWIKNQEGK